MKWEETGVPGGNPRKHGENMQTPHRKARAGPETNPGPSCCEATALTTAPPCRPGLLTGHNYVYVSGIYYYPCHLIGGTYITWYSLLLPSASAIKKSYSPMGNSISHSTVRIILVPNFDELRALETRQTPAGLLLYIRGRWKDAGQSSSDKSTKKSPMAGRYEGLSDRHRPICVGLDSDELPITKSSEEYNSALNSSDAPTEVCFTLRCRPSICGSPYDFPIF